MSLLTIANLHVSADTHPILRGVDLSVESHEIVAIMGRNGSGKSTLALTIAGHPQYTVTDGAITWDSTPITDATPEERAHHGIFLSFQHPLALPGITVTDFLRAAVAAHHEATGATPPPLRDYLIQLREAMQTLGIPAAFASRYLNDGFSGGEKKKLEILQALILKPKLLILDEIDSGLDIDAIKTVAIGVNQLHEQGTAVVIITHYRRILNYITPTTVYIMAKGAIVKSGDMALVDALEQSSYDAVTA